MEEKSKFRITQLAVPFVSLLIAFLSYSSQYLFPHLQPGSLTSSQSWKFNTLVACIWICYARACFTDAGRVPADWKPSGLADRPINILQRHEHLSNRHRWCRRCEALKPPRAHHCKTCQCCVPKMDHHCPWTNNCVSHFTYPHFIRFVFYAVVSMGYLEYFLYIRGAVIWENRNLPSYLGPTTWQLFHLLALFLANSAVLIALSILLFRSLWMLGSNETTIEGWEIERHDTLVRRARVFGGCLDGPDGTKIKIVKQEFPYDIGIWNNIRAGMGGSNNFISWFWPFARTAKRDTGLEFETNGFEDDSVSWPPPDPDRMHRYVPRGLGENEMLLSDNGNYDAEEIHAFRQRQQNDYLRVSGDQTEHRTKTFHKRFTDILDGTDSDSGEEGWRNSEGDRLRDFGVDEEIEFYDEDDVPLATLIQRRKGRAKDK